MPEDRQRALDDDPRAGDFFATLDGRNRYAVLHRIQDAKRPETRARRIARFVDMLHRHLGTQAFIYAIGAVLMAVAAVVELLVGIDAEGESLEDIAEPLSATGG